MVGLPEPEPDRPFSVYPGNWQALEIFIASSTQWRIAPMGGRAGLDYPAVESVLRLLRIPSKKHPDLFHQIRLLERGALEAFSAQAAKT